MSSIRLCDSNDCYQTQEDAAMHHINYETAEILKKHYNKWMNGCYEDICKDCIDNINTDYPEFFEVDSISDLRITRKYERGLE